MSRNSIRLNIRLAKKLWGEISHPSLRNLVGLIEVHALSVASGDLLYLRSGWYVTHSGLLALARRNRCAGIHVQLLAKFCDPSARRWAFRATVYKTRNCRGFVGYGDADPSNVSPLMKGAEMRVAETRAVSRALRKAYGIGICSVEEIGSVAEPESYRQVSKIPPQPANGDYGGPKVRDRLCQIIRHHQLDPNLVKAYAMNFCGVTALREATREQIENFVAHLADWAEKDRNGLLCQLNSYLYVTGTRCSMRRYFESLRPADRSAIESVPDGLFLVRVARVEYRWQARKSYYQIRFAVLEPKHLAGCLISGRLYCTARAMWKLTWFLRDFGCDTELLGKDEIDDQVLVGLQGVVKVSHAIVHGISVLNLNGFAPL